ncbi:MAG: sensor histidine kinase, partial [Rhodoferax sp.]
QLLLRVWQPVDLLNTAALEYGLLFASISLIMVVLLLNIHAGVWLRDPLTPWFASYLVLLAVLFAGNSGLLSQYLYPESASANNWVINVVSIAVIAFGNAFYVHLFRIGPDQVLLYRSYWLGFWFAMMGLLPTLLGYFTETMQVLTSMVLIFAVMGFVMSVRLWRNGTPGGGLMLLANVISMVGITAYVMFARGLLAGGALMLHSLQWSSLGTIVALELAIGARYRVEHDKRTEAERDALNERSVREQQGHFLAMLAHELRTSLSVLKLALGRQPMSAKSVARAERAMEGMGQVIERSIQMEKLADGSMVLEQLPCDGVQLLEAVIADSAAPQRFALTVQPGPMLKTDAKLLRVILANLIDNAVKYAAADSPIDVVVAAEEGWIVRVENAVGPAGAPDADRVFEKYYRGEQAHAQTGSGLGLHIAQALAQRLGGQLVCDVHDRRVRFTLQLPLVMEAHRITDVRSESVSKLCAE